MASRPGRHVRTVVHYVGSTTFGGTERIALDLLAGMDRSRWRPVLFHHADPGIAPLLQEAARAGLELRAVPRIAGRLKALRLAQFTAALRAERPSVFHAHLPWPQACRPGLFAAALLQVPAVVAHAQLFSNLPPERQGIVRRMASQGIGRYLAVSEAVARRLREQMGVPAGKIRIIHNAVPVELFDRPADASQRRALLGSGEDQRPLVLTIARLDAQKGLTYLLAAAAQVPEAVFLLAGEGEQRAALEAQAAQLGLGDRVRFLGHRDDIPALLAACDLFVLPSLFEGFPLSILEASAAGKPVIATAVDGTGEAVRPGETGLLVPPADPTALAGAIRTLLADSALAARLGAAARAHARQEFGREAMIRRVGEIYGELLEPRHE